MNTIIERLSQIEERSVAAAAEGTEKKKELTAQYEERTRQFDRELDQETEERIRKPRVTGGCHPNRPQPDPVKRSGPVHPAAGAPL